MRPELRDAIDDLFIAFNEASRPVGVQDLDVCPCCMSDEECRALLLGERRSLADAVIMPYVHTARSAVTQPDYLYFFPRIAELIFVEGAPYEWEPIFDRLGAVESGNWTLRQRKGLAQFMGAIIADVARLAEEAPDVDRGWMLQDVMCCIGRSGLDVTPHLNQLLDHPALLVDFVRHNPGAEITGRLSYSFQGTDSGTAHAAILDWVHSEPVLALITAP